jgi:hypothetical protein
MKKLWLRHPTDAVVVGFFDKDAVSEGDTSAKAFAKIAHEDKNMTYYVCTNQTIAEKFKVEVPHIMTLKAFDEKRNDLPKGDHTDEEKVIQFKLATTIPRLVDYDPDKTKGFQKGKVWTGAYSKFLVLMHNGSDPKYGEMRSQMDAACQQMGTKYNRGDVTCLNIDASAGDLAYGLSGYYNVGVDDLPQVMVLQQDMPKSRSVVATYKMSDEFSTDNVVKFYKSYIGGEATRYYRSEAPKPAESGVTFLVGSDFKDRMETEFKDKSVMLKLADSHIERFCWNGGENCPANFSAAHIAYTSLPEAYSSIKSLAFAEVDIRLNEFNHFAPDYDVLNYDTAHLQVAQEGPAHYLYSASRKAPKKFVGDISNAEEVAQFFKEAGLSASDEDVMDEL